MFLLTILNPLSQYLVLTERPFKIRFFPHIARVRQFCLTCDLTSPVTSLHDGSWFDQRVVWSSVLAPLDILAQVAVLADSDLCDEEDTDGGHIAADGMETKDGGWRLMGYM